MKHNRICVILQEMLNKIKLISEEIEICQIDCTIQKKGQKKKKWVGFYQKYHTQKMNIRLVFIYSFLNLFKFQYFSRFKTP
jgi:hypothetical protein